MTHTTQAIETYLTRDQILSFIKPQDLLEGRWSRFKVVILPDIDERTQEQEEMNNNKEKLVKEFQDSLISGKSNLRI